MTNKQKRQPIGIPVGGEFASTEHAVNPKVTLPATAEPDLETMGNNAARAVYEVMGDVQASDDGGGMYLLIDSSDGESLHSGCPTLASDNPDAKWYVESSDGNFYKEHPDFGHDAEPEAVASWIRETSARYEAGLNADRAALRVQDVFDGAESHNDGDGIYLTVPTSDPDEPVVAGCPVSANDNPQATWYVESTGGDFHEDHPTFTHDADPEEVAAWIREVKTRMPMGHKEKVELANKAVADVKEAMPEAAVENFGQTDFLMFEIDGESSHLVAECPVDGAGNDMKWNCYVNDGRFAETHPEFHSGTDPQKIAAWIREVKTRIPARAPSINPYE